ncbi:DUF6175 family protein [uncultured Bacteroides sp.]|uniref:DUF6175 family protein n=1 Tax=uncultured Bacteroides sp. TaxID=162156 RepID=UPI0026150FC5|nr:DUF6175 family protein [uncultured Bacteroides sp.]
MKKILTFALCIYFSTNVLVAQRATKPRIMVRPAETWCTENGYMSVIENQDTKELMPDYEVALQTNGDLTLVISKIESLMNDRDFRISNFLQAIRGVKAQSARNSGITSKSTGNNIAISFMDEINNAAKADIYFDVYWKVTKNGPKSIVSYTLSAYDTYTYNSIASISGTGAPSFSAEIPILVEEAVTSNMDAFLEQLQGYFDDCIENGRAISLEINTFDDGTGIDMESEYNGKELREIIEDWVSDNSINRSYNLVDDTETTMLFQDVRIPLYDERERPMNAGSYARGLRKHLESFQIPIKQGSSTLGRCQLIIGKK